MAIQEGEKMIEFVIGLFIGVFTMCALFVGRGDK